MGSPGGTDRKGAGGTARRSLGLLLALALGACAADGRTSSLAPSPGRLAQREADPDHVRLVRAYGGEVRAPAAKAYLNELVGRLAPPPPDGSPGYDVTILDSPLVNAFALPTGRLYVTRGLLALSNDGAEIGSVMAHEIAHVVRRHADARGELEARSVLVTRVVTDLLKNEPGGANVRDASKLTLAQFSRDQEYEADEAGIAMLVAAGFDAGGATRSLRSLGRAATLDTRQGGGAQTADRLATHPATADRVKRAALVAKRVAAEGVGRTDRTRYLAAIEGLPFGDDPADGIVRGRRFLHPRLGVTFTAPDGFALENTARAVVGETAAGERRLLFDAVDAPEGQDLGELLRTSWAEELDTGSVTVTGLGGHPVAMASARSGEWLFRLAAARIGPQTFRLILADRTGGQGLERDFTATLATLRELGRPEVADLRPMRLRLVRAGAGDDLQSLVARMGTDKPLERFLVLNGMERGDPIRPGERYKIVAE
ncbi:MAG: M48 family metalloprotease [Methylobacteriaceae bacterium]|nr:M48 family metalloprotease [Methylobacteriaceae bacterium]